MKKKVTKKKVSSSQEFLERKELLLLEEENSLRKHTRKMEELKFMRANEKIHHENEMERQRIRSAEIQRTIARKEQSRRYGGNKYEKYDNEKSCYQP